jgi:surfactin synthase thioesterase subunit
VAESVITAVTRLICFPSYSGSTDQIYEDWRAWLAPELEVVCLPRQPFRAQDHGGNGVYDLHGLLRGLLPSLQPLLDRPFAFFGHGLGALDAFETCRALKTAGLPVPFWLFLSGVLTPHLPAARDPRHASPTVDFLRSAKPSLGLPVTVFCGSRDEELEPSRVEAWRRLTDGECEICLLPGGSAFLSENGHLVASGLLHRCRTSPGVRLDPCRRSRPRCTAASGERSEEVRPT